MGMSIKSLLSKNNVLMNVIDSLGNEKRSLSVYDMASTPSVVPGSSVVSQRTVELVKQGYMYTVQTVFSGLAVTATKDILIDPTAFTGSYGVLYGFEYNVTQGKAIAEFFGGGTYIAGTPLFVGNRNENSLNTAKTVVSENPTVSVLGTGTYKYLAGGEVQGNQLAGGTGGDADFPTEIKLSVPRLLRIVQSGGTGFFDLELRLIFAEIP